MKLWLKSLPPTNNTLYYINLSLGAAFCYTNNSLAIPGAHLNRPARALLKESFCKTRAAQRRIVCIYRKARRRMRRRDDNDRHQRHRSPAQDRSDGAATRAMNSTQEDGPLSVALLYYIFVHAGQQWVAISGWIFGRQWQSREPLTRRRRRHRWLRRMLLLLST